MVTGLYIQTDPSHRRGLICALVTLANILKLVRIFLSSQHTVITFKLHRVTTMRPQFR